MNQRIIFGSEHEKKGMKRIEKAHIKSKSLPIFEQYVGETGTTRETLKCGYDVIRYITPCSPGQLAEPQALVIVFQPPLSNFPLSKRTRLGDSRRIVVGI